MPPGSFPAAVPRPTPRPERSAEGMAFTPNLPTPQPPMPTARPERSAEGMSFTPGLPAAMPRPAIPVPTARPPVQGPPRPVGGMSFTPALPVNAPPAQYAGYGAPMAPGKQIYGRVPQEQGPVPQYDARQKRQAAGTYTAPYDVKAPAQAPFRRGANPGLPPGYAERYGLGAKPETVKTEAEQPSTGGFFKAVTDGVNTAVETVKEKKAQVDQAVKDVEKKYGPITESKVKLAKLFLGIGGGTSGPQSRFPTGNGAGNTAALQDPQVRAIVAQALAATGEAPPITAAPPVDWSYFTNVKTREQALRELLGEEWNA